MGVHGSGGLRAEGFVELAAGVHRRIGARAMTLPGAPFLAREGAELQLDGQPLADLGQRFGTPLFVYSRRAMRAAFDAYERALQGRKHLGNDVVPLLQ